MKAYNLDFLIAGFILLLLVLYHFKGQKKLDSAGNRIFRFCMGIGLADVMFDILCTLLIMSEDNSLIGITKLSLTIFYVLQVIFPLALVYYAQILRETSAERIKKDMIVWTVIPVIMLFLVAANYWGGMLFYYDREGIYHQGPWYMLMYYYAFLYAGAVAFLIIVYYRELGPKNAAVLWEFLLIEGSCAMIQAFSGTYLMTGFGISVGITVMYLTIGNPSTYMDHMTGVFGKHYFGKWFQEQLSKGNHIHVISIDAIRLKQINKIFGNSVGDQLLLRITEELQQISDTVEVFRMSGKRFFLVMQTLVDYEQSREKVQQLFGQAFEVNGNYIPFPAIICGIINGETLQEDAFLAYVDYMIALVKDTKETVLIQSDEKSMNGFIYEQEIERFLNEAIEKDLFEVYYQPVYSIETDHYITMEALSRLWHPTLGYVPPDVFITLAEKNGQIPRIGQLQFRRICKFIKENEEIMKQIRNIKFNLSPLEILKYGHVQSLMDMIEEYELPFSYFQFEITETVATEYSANLYQAVDQFLKAGIGLCLDDFGSGYANMNTVLKLPFSCIKLDRSLLRGLNEDPQVAFFYRSMVSVLHEMGYKIISEGVETEEETKMLREWGVDMIQGYYFSRPVSGKEIVEMLTGKQ